MSLYFKTDTTWQVAEDSTLAQTMASRSTSKIENTDITRYVEHSMVVGAGQTAQINFGNVTNAKALHIKTNQPILVRVNGATTGIPVGHTANESASLTVDATNLTSLAVDVPGGTDAEIYISLPGA